MAVRCRPNTVLAVAFDLKVFFGVVGKPPGEVTAADVFGFITAQRSGAARPTPVASIDGAQCSSLEIYELLVLGRGWSALRFARFLGQLMISALLSGSAGDPSPV